MEHGSLGTRLGYRPALDGLRALAIAAVVPYHWTGGARGIAGGFLGVNLFFVLSGFLITRLLREEHDDTGGIGRRAFYRRRFARLMPGYFALLAVVVSTSRLSSIFGSPHAVRVGAVSSLFYVTNWVAAARGFGALGPLAHLWSLAIEEQFYLLWPLVLIVLLRRMPARSVGRLAAVAAGATFLQVALRSFSSNELSLHVGTAGQGMGFLLAGSAAALLFPLGPEFVATSFGRFVQRWGAWSIAPIIPFLMFYNHERDLFYYRGVFALLAVCMVVLVLVALLDGPLRDVLANRMLVWLGRRSYSVYLWHYPAIFVVNWCNSRYALHWRLPMSCAVALVLTIACAEASFRYVEHPLRRRFGRPRASREQRGPRGAIAAAS